MSYARITEVRNPKKAELHDHMQLHVPLTDTQVTFCKACGMPIFKPTVHAAHQSTRDPYLVAQLVTETQRYNKFTLDILRKTPRGALFIAKNIRKTDSLRKVAALDAETAADYAINVDGFSHPQTRNAVLKDPMSALQFAKFIDKEPKLDTWRAVIDYDMEKVAYLNHFKMTESDLLTALRNKCKA